MSRHAFLDRPIARFVADALGAPVAHVANLARGASSRGAHARGAPVRGACTRGAATRGAARGEAAAASGAASVLRVVAADGGVAVLKLHRALAKHRREVAAYRAWGAAGLGPELPRLLAVRSAGPPALLLSWRPGQVDSPSDDPEAPRLHGAAGAWLARLHRLPPQPDPMPLDEAYARRAAGWFSRAERHLDHATVADARRRLDAALPELAGRPRVPCHRDFTAGNWLARRGRLTGVIDLEHARSDVAEVDLVRLAAHTWPGRPELREAFLGGYRAAGGPADPDAPRLPALLVLEAVATVAWAAEHGQAAVEKAGRRALARALDGAP